MRQSAGRTPLFCFNRDMASPSKLTVGDRSYEIYRLDELQASYDVARLPYTLRVLLENVLRNGDEQDVDAVARWDAKSEPSNEISFAPSRVLLQDLTGVPAVVDLAAMRNAMADLGGDPAKINPLIPAELVIDHSVQVDAFASRIAARSTSAGTPVRSWSSTRDGENEISCDGSACASQRATASTSSSLPVRRTFSRRTRSVYGRPATS